MRVVEVVKFGCWCVHFEGVRANLTLTWKDLIRVIRILGLRWFSVVVGRICTHDNLKTMSGRHSVFTADLQFLHRRFLSHISKTACVRLSVIHFVRMGSDGLNLLWVSHVAGTIRDLRHFSVDRELVDKRHVFY